MPKRTDSNARRLLVALGGLVRLIAVIGGVPLLLTKVVGWPLPHAIPTPDQIRDGFQVGAYDDKIFLKGLACVAWLAWAMIICSLIIHIVGGARSVRVRKPAFINGRLFAMTGKWLSGVTVVASSVLSRASIAGAQTLPPTTLSSVVVPLSSNVAGQHFVDDVVSIGISTTAQTYTVRGNSESLWTVAEQTYGDGSKWQTIYEANKALLSNPEVLPKGTVLTLPGLTTETAPEAPVGQTPVGQAPAEEPPILGTVTVVKGDHFWKIADDVLTQAYGRPATNVEIAPYWRDMVELNRSDVKSGNVNLIYSGEHYQVQLPELPADVLDRTITLPRLVTRVDTPIEIPAASLSEPVVSEPVESGPVAAVVSEVPAVSVESVLSVPAVESVVAPVPAATVTSDDGVLMGAVAAALGLTGVGAGALLLALRRRRATAARIRGVGEQLEPVTEDMMSLLSRLQGVAAGEVTTTVDAVQRLLRRSLANHGGLVPSVLVTRAGANGVELLLDEPLENAPRGFVPVDGGHCWVLSPDVTHAELDAARGEPGFMPALVSIGSNEIGSVLVDIERLGALEIRSESTEVGVGVLAAMAAEWEGAPWMNREESQIVAIGLPSEMFSAYERVRQVRDSDLGEEVQRLVDASRADSMRYPSGKHAERVATDAFVFGPTIVLIGPEHGEEAMTLAEAALVSGSGLAVVALTGLPRGSSQLVITGTAAVLEPFGLDLDCFVMLEPAMALAVAKVVDASDEVHPAAPWPQAWGLDDDDSDDDAWADDEGLEPSTLHESTEQFDDVLPDSDMLFASDELDQTTASLRELTMEQFVDLSRFDGLRVSDSVDDDGPDDDGPKGTRSQSRDDAGSDDPGDGDGVGVDDVFHVLDGVDEAALVLAELSVPAGTVGLSLLGDAMPMLLGVESPSGRAAPRSIELLTFLSLKGPRTQSQILEALWPDRLDQATVVQALSRIRRTIGSATITFADGRYLLQGVDCDWTRFLRLVEAANRLDGRGAMVLLRAALEMVKSRPFAGRQIYDGRASSWDWLDLGYVESDVLVRVVDAAEGFAELALHAGDGSAVLWSCEIARLCEPRREATHTLRMQAFALLGDRDGLHREVRHAVESATFEDPLAESPFNVMQLLRVLEEKMSSQRREQASS